MVQIDLDAIAQKRDVSKRQAAALRTALASFMRARNLICKGHDCVAEPDPETFSEATFLYLRGVNQGVIPYRILNYRKIQIDRATTVKRAIATEQDYRALIQPAIDQLAAYGAGGIKAETLAPFIAALPIAAAISGK
jgi:hypothetical protein